MRRRLALLALLALVVLLLAGCGGSKKSSADAGGTVPAGADKIPASVPVLITVDSSFGANWKALTALVDRFPGRAKLIASAQQSLAKNGVDFDKDIKATVGPEVDLAVWDFGNGKSAKTVGLTQPKDKAGFEAALKKGEDPSVFEEQGDWVLFSDDQASLDAFKALGGSTLAGEGDVKDAFAAVPSDAGARIYANGAALQQSLATALKSAGPLGSLGAISPSGGSVQWIVGALEPKSDGTKIEAVIKTKGGKAQNFDTKLLDKVPASALFVTAFDGKSDTSLGGQLKALQSNPMLGSSAAQIQALTGVTLADIAQLLSGRGVIYARAGTPIPELTIVEGDLDVDKATGTLDKLVTALARLTQIQPSHVTVSGEKLTQIMVGSGGTSVAIVYGKVDGNLVVTTNQAAIADLKSDGGKLVDDAAFKDAESEAGDTGSTAGLVYVNVQGAVASISGLGALGGNSISPETQANLAPLRGLLFSANALDKDTLRVTGFLGIQ